MDCPEKEDCKMSMFSLEMHSPRSVTVILHTSLKSVLLRLNKAMMVGATISLVQHAIAQQNAEDIGAFFYVTMSSLVIAGLDWTPSRKHFLYHAHFR